MSDSITAIGMKDGYRLRTVPDTDAEDPRTWGDHVTEGDDIHTRWNNGEVYIVILEKAVRYRAVDDPDKVIMRWEEVEALGGCYLDNDTTPLSIARTYGWEGTKTGE